MGTETSPIIIDYFTDALCVWAWIAQPRLEELHRQYGNRVQIRHRNVDIFGDSHNKILTKWGEQSGFENFASHVEQSASSFEHCNIHPDIWRQVRPCSSQQAHLFLKAVQLVADDQAVESMSLRVREAFFCEALDIANLSRLLELADEKDLDCSGLETVIHDAHLDSQ
jgi:predicted DsbA family dithiol-disulfide isomerase